VARIADAAAAYVEAQLSSRVARESLHTLGSRNEVGSLSNLSDIVDTMVDAEDPAVQ
jgi:hypothetical protein